MLNDFGFPLIGRTKIEVLSHLNNYLLNRLCRGETTVLVVDEAHLLNWELLEEIRLLTNLETSQYKLLQIVLVGQPELDRKIDSDELRQLKQRIAMRCRLEPMGLKDLRGYIRRRLELAGARSHAETIFSDKATQAIHHFSCGIPRLANTLCENSLISGYGRQLKQVTAAVVQEISADLRLNAGAEHRVLESDGLEGRKKVFRVVSE